jgi:hypothetical protein
MTQIFTKHTKILRGAFYTELLDTYMGCTGRSVFTPLGHDSLSRLSYTSGLLDRQLSVKNLKAI